ncbi:MAG: hypothetical protein DMG57_04210 [Acidobacteria bacterium]|nr:MAG: hypothetical protein DMG57_04210 [Acidobacteriota bacterium]
MGRGLAVLCDAPIGDGGSWGQDGDIIASLNIPGGLSRIPSGGGAVEPLTELKQDATHRFPQGPA